MSLFKTSGGNDAFYPVWLSKLFFDTLNAPRPNNTFEMPDKTVIKIPFLNGGLFEKDKHDESILTFPPLMFHNPGNSDTDKERGFLDFLNAYNFTVYEDSPDDHTVAVDPEMLGQIFENLLEDNEDKAAFYTPKEIVHYMCKQSLIEYLCTPETLSPIGKIEMSKTQTDMFGNDGRKGQLSLETPVQDTLLTPERDATFKNSVENLIKNQEVSTGLSKHLNYLNNRLDAVRICDPAIGSGAFPMGLLHEIFNTKVLIMDALNGASPTPSERVEIKLHIIQNSIYGVDIEKGAVDIARLRFWLSLIVDEQAPKALPNLDYKIVVGNSLVAKFENEVIAIDWEVKEGTQTGLFGNSNVETRRNLLREISKKQHDFFIPENHDKKSIALKIKDLKVDLLINQLELMINNIGRKDEPKSVNFQRKALFMKAQELYFQTLGWQQNIKKLIHIKDNSTVILHFFDWKLDFPEVLNPTLVGNNGGFDIVIGNPPYGVSIKGDYRKNVSKYLGKVPDYEIYYYFIELAYKLLKKNGVKSYIIPNTFLFNVFASEYRKKLIENWSLNIVDCTAFKIFEGATVFNAITFFQKEKITNLISYKNTRNSLKFNDLISQETLFIDKKELLLNNQNWGLAFKLEKKILLLIGKIKANAVTLESLFPELSQGLIAYDRHQGQSVETIKNRVFHYDSFVKDDLKQNLWGEDVTRYSVKWNEKEWIDYHGDIANPRLPKFFQGERLLIREITNPRIFCAYTTEELYHDPSIIVILKSEKCSIKFLLAILNSKLISFYHFNSSPKASKGAFPKILVEDIKNFPIPQIPLEVQKPFEDLANQILAKKKSGEDTSALEAEIDRLVYKLYNLTEAEIAEIEGK